MLMQDTQCYLLYSVVFVTVLWVLLHLVFWVFFVLFPIPIHCQCQTRKRKRKCWLCSSMLSGANDYETWKYICSSSLLGYSYRQTDMFSSHCSLSCSQFFKKQNEWQRKKLKSKRHLNTEAVLLFMHFLITFYSDHKISHSNKNM